MRSRTQTLIECHCGDQIELDDTTPAESQARMERWTQEHAGCDPEADHTFDEELERIHLQNEWVDWYGGEEPTADG